MVPFVDLTLTNAPLQGEIKTAIAEIVDRGDFIMGQAVTSFETAFAKACNVPYALGVACGTDAIALGLRACGVGPGDEVILPANTFIATLIGIERSGAKPILVDCDRHTALIDLDAAAAAVTARTKAIVPVHLYGQMVSPSALREFSATHNVLVFEDAAQAHMAEREGYRAGSVGVAAAFSFYPSKNLGAFGDGGLVVTQDEAVAQKLRSLRNYGAPKKYVHADKGTNSRLDSIQAAILNVKLPHLQGWNRDRNQAAQLYDRLLDSIPGIDPIRNDSGEGHVYHLYVVRVEGDRDALQQKLGDRGISTGIHYPIPCHLQPGYRDLGYPEGAFPQSETLCETILSLPMYPGITEAQVRATCEAIAS